MNMPHIINVYGPTGSNKTAAVTRLIEFAKQSTAKSTSAMIDDYKYTNVEQLIEDCMGKADIVFVVTQEKINHVIVEAIEITDFIKTVIAATINHLTK